MSNEDLPPWPIDSQSTELPSLTWHELQAALRRITNHQDAEALLNAELSGSARLRWLLRIQSRRNVLRNEAEITELTNRARS